jgi:hypothetical protein
MQIRYLESLASMAHHSKQKTIFMPLTDDARNHNTQGALTSGNNTASGESSTVFGLPSATIAEGSKTPQTLTYQPTGSA